LSLTLTCFRLCLVVCKLLLLRMNTGDRNTEYQALEGLSSVAYQQQKYDCSCEYLKSALCAASGVSSGQLSCTQQRLVNKITRVIQLQFQINKQVSVPVIICSLNLHCCCQFASS